VCVCVCVCVSVCECVSVCVCVIYLGWCHGIIGHITKVTARWALGSVSTGIGDQLTIFNGHAA